MVSQSIYILAVYPIDGDDPVLEQEVHLAEHDLQEMLGIDETLIFCYSLTTHQAQALLDAERCSYRIDDQGEECFLEVYRDGSYELYTSPLPLELLDYD